MNHPAHTSILSESVTEELSFSLEDLARACRREPEWVRARVEAGLFKAVLNGVEWRFSSYSYGRARRIADLEIQFNADPELAALTTDLIEEVLHLRRQLARLSEPSGPTEDLLHPA